MTVLSIIAMLTAFIVGQPTVPASTTPTERASVYLFASAAGWPTNWASFNNHEDFVPGKRPGTPDMRYYYSLLAERATRMGVDGVIITTPDIRVPRNPDPISHWRYRMEGRQDALEEGALAIADRAAIRDGLVHLRQRVGRVILYTGYPNDVSALETIQTDGIMPNALVRDTALCDGYVKCNLGPWLETGMVDACIIDSAGIYYQRAACAAVIRSIRRLYPRVRLGGEGHPMHLSGPEFPNCPLVCSLTTYTSAVGPGSPLDVPWRYPITDAFWPVIVAFTEPHSFVPGGNNYRPSRFNDALDQLRLRRSIAVQAEWVGYADKPSEENRILWESFMSQARQIRQQVGTPQVP